MKIRLEITRRHLDFTSMEWNTFCTPLNVSKLNLEFCLSLSLLNFVFVSRFIEASL